MRVLSDYHHQDLYWSFHRLFVERLGHELYMPIGMEYWDAGFWDYGFHDKHVAEQYLGHARIVQSFDDFVTTFDRRHGVVYKGLTLEQFKADPPDVLLSTMPQTDITFDRLKEQHAPHAKRICQIGNDRQFTHVPNVMVSALPVLQRHQHFVIYRQEIDLNTFYPAMPHTPNGRPTVRCFINNLPGIPMFKEWAMFSQGLNEFEWESFGIACKNGNIDNKHELASLMRGATWGWQVKGFGDGFGHVAHCWPAVGRPVITNLKYYRSRMAGALYIDNVTCVDIDAPDAAKRIRRYSEPDEHRAMCERTAERFKDVVNYESDAIAVQRFLEALL